MRVLCVVLSAGLLLPLAGADAAFERPGPQVSGFSFAGAGLAVVGDLWAGLGNPAGLAFLQSASCGVCITPALFGIPGLNHLWCGAAFPAAWGVCAVSGSAFGLPGYRETCAVLDHAYAPTPGLSLGVRVSVCHLQIDGYGATTVLSLDAGFHMEAEEGWGIGAVIRGLGTPGFGATGEHPPQTIECGLAWRPVEDLVLCCALSKDVLFPPGLHVGAEYAPLEALRLRCGLSDEPSAFGTGCAIVAPPFRVDYAMCTHEELGPTHSIALLYSW